MPIFVPPGVMPGSGCVFRGEPSARKEKTDVQAKQPRLLLRLLQPRSVRLQARRDLCVRLCASLRLPSALPLQRLRVLQQREALGLRADEATKAGADEIAQLVRAALGSGRLRGARMRREVDAFQVRLAARRAYFASTGRVVIGEVPADAAAAVVAGLAVAPERRVIRGGYVSLAGEGGQTRASRSPASPLHAACGSI